MRCWHGVGHVLYRPAAFAHGFHPLVPYTRARTGCVTEARGGFSGALLALQAVSEVRRIKSTQPNWHEEESFSVLVLVSFHGYVVIGSLT
jgi:hypothetical protein